jgi:hypothetical protein
VHYDPGTDKCKERTYGSTQISQSDWIELNCGKNCGVIQWKSKDLVTENDNAIIENYSSINNFKFNSC